MIRRCTHILALMAVAVFAVPVQAQVMSTQPAPLDGQQPDGVLPNRLQGGIGIIERLGDRVSPETPFVNSEGQEVTMRDALAEGKPIVIAFVYHSCPMLCSLILDGLADAMAESDLDPTEYTALAVSFDERDTPEAAARAKEKYVAEVGREGAARAMHFWTGNEDNIQTLADEVGFGFAWDARTQEYAHNAALIFLSPDGTVTRYLYGAQFYPRDFKLALLEAGQGTIGSTADRILLTCYQFDEESRSYSLFYLGVMKWVGGGLVLMIALGLGFFWRREVKRQKDGTPWPDFPSDAAPAT